MDRDKELLQNIVLIRVLYSKGYREKIIKMVTGLNQSFINKIINYKLHKNIVIDVDNVEVSLTKQQKIRLNTANKILACNEIRTNDLEEDIRYMQLLKFFLIEKEDIYNLYNHWGKTRIAKYLLKKDIDILKFDSTLIGISKEDYLDLIIDYFIES